jgi:uncharacterized phosphosugar-binding protein
MAFDLNTVAHGDSLAFLSTTFPASAVLEIRSGAAPGVANAATGTILWTFTLASGWAAVSGVTRALAGVPLTANAVATGTAGHFRLRNTGDTARMEGSAAASVVIATSALTAANGNVLNFASTTGVVVGMNISGTGIVAGAAVIAVTGTTVTMSFSSTAGVASAASLTFAADLVLDNISLVSGQSLSVNGLTISSTDNKA